MSLLHKAYRVIRKLKVRTNRVSIFDQTHRKCGFERLEDRVLLAADLRTPMADEGYLQFHFDEGPELGQERFGSTQVAHLSNLGKKDSDYGYDLGSVRVNIHATVVEDSAGKKAGRDLVEFGSIRADFDFANQIYAQAGISVVMLEGEFAGVVANPNVTFPVDTIAESRAVASASRSVRADAVNLYYVKDFGGAEAATNAIALSPNYAPLGVTKGVDDGILLSDNAWTQPDLLGHELGHFLLGSAATTTEYRHVGGQDDDTHSQLDTNVLASSAIRRHPTFAPLPDKYRGKDGGTNLDTSAPREPGRPNGNIGGIDQFNDLVYLDANGNGTFDVFDEPLKTQIEAIHESTFIQRPAPVPNDGFGDRVDFLWVEDNQYLEGIAGADMHAPNSDRDMMIWGIGDIQDPIVWPYDQGNWLADKTNLPAAEFAGEWFNVVDVFSQIARYADNDVDGGNWSQRASALDYSIQFATDWSEYDVDWSDGILVDVFDDGWTEASKADDFVARWKAPDGMEAKYIRIGALLGNGGDGNTQIDGIVAAQVDGAAPQAEDDAYSTPLDTPLYVQSSEGVLMNDSDPDGDPLAAVLADAPANGAVSLSPDGSLVYTPNTSFVGQDYFTYRASDGQFLTNLATVTIDVQNSSPPAISISDSSAYESDGSISFDVTLSDASTNVVKVDYASSDGSAEAYADYSSVSGTIEFQPGQTSATITVTVNNDSLDENAENFTITLSNPINAVIDDSEATGTIDDDDDSPTVSITGVTVDENVSSGNAVFTVSLSEASGQDVTVYYDTWDDSGSISATAGQDYTGVQNGSVVIEAGETEAPIEVAISDDSIDEYDELFHAVLSWAENAIIGEDYDAVATIIDDDDPPTISIADASGNEANGTIEFQVTLSAASEKDVTAYYHTSDSSGNYQATAGIDYSEVQGDSVLIGAGQTSATINVYVNDDFIDEHDETFLMTLSSADNANIGDSDAVGTIGDDDDPPTISVVDASANEGDGTIVFYVELSTASEKEIAVDLQTSDGSAIAGADYDAVTGTVTFDPGDTQETVSVNLTPDTLDEEDETFVLTLDNPVNTTLGSSSATGTIYDDDQPPSVSIAGVTVGESAGVAQFALTLSEASSRDVTVEYYTSGDSGNYQATAGIDYSEVQSDSVVIAAGQTNATIDVYITDDSLDEHDETFLVALSSADNADIGNYDAVGTITDDDDPPTISIADASANEADGTIVFYVELSAASEKNVTAYYDTSDSSGNYQATAGIDYSEVQSDSVVIAAGQSSATINVYINDDFIDEHDETFLVALSSADNATLGQNGSAQGTIIDDDDEPQISVQSAYANESDGTMVFYIDLSAASEKEISVDFQTSDGSAIAGADYDALTGTVTFNPGDTQKTASVDITPDTLDEEDETFALTLDNPVNATLGSNSATGTIYDDDDPPAVNIAAATVGESAGTAVFNLTLSETSGKDVTVYYYTSDDWGNDSATAGQDYTGVSYSSVVIAAGDSNATIQVAIEHDSIDEYDERFHVLLSWAENANIGASNDAVGTITDDDAPPQVTVNDITVAEDVGTASFDISLSTASEKEITIDYQPTAGTATPDEDYYLYGGSVTFSPGDTLQQVWISINDDDIDEPDQTFGIEISTSTPSDAYITDSQGDATIIDNDAAPTIYVYDAYAYEWDGVIEFYVYLSNPSEIGVSFQFATADGAAVGEDYQADSGTYTFAGTSGSILISVIDDSVQEDDEQFTLNVSNANNGTLDGVTSVTGTIYDDDYLEPLTLDLPAIADSMASHLVPSQVAPLAREAARRWSLVGAASAELRTLLATVDIRIVDLPGSQLGAAGRNRILLDVDAAGYGWFIDSSPRDDREFQRIIGGGELHATPDSAAFGHVDLQTVITHEFGHLLGYGDLPAARFPHHIMNETIGLGTRRTPDSVSHRIDAHLPNQQPPHLYFDTIRASMLAGSATNKETQRLVDALDTVLAEEDFEWDDAVDSLFGRGQLDRVFQTLGRAG